MRANIAYIRTRVQNLGAIRRPLRNNCLSSLIVDVGVYSCTNTENYNEYEMVGFRITLSDAIGRSHATSPLSNGSNLCTYESQINLNSFPIHFLIVFDRSFAIYVSQTGQRATPTARITCVARHLFYLYPTRPRFRVHSTVAPRECGIGQFMLSKM